MIEDTKAECIRASSADQTHHSAQLNHIECATVPYTPVNKNLDCLMTHLQLLRVETKRRPFCSELLSWYGFDKMKTIMHLYKFFKFRATLLYHLLNWRF